MCEKCVKGFLRLSLVTCPVALYPATSESEKVRGRSKAHRAVDEVKQSLDERGPVWWDDGSPDFNRHMAKNTLYANWYAKLALSDHGGL